MNVIPDRTDSTTEERREFIKKRFSCKSDCEICGLCKVFRGKDPEMVYEDYIQGKRSFMEISQDLRR